MQLSSEAKATILSINGLSRTPTNNNELQNLKDEQLQLLMDLKLVILSIEFSKPLRVCLRNLILKKMRYATKVIV